MPEILIQAPSGECIHVDEVKLDRRIDFDDDDAKLKMLITAARQAAETRTRQQFLHARWKLVLDRFPGGGCAELQNSVNIPSYAIQLPHTPLVHVVSIDYTDMSGAMQTMPPSDYAVNAALAPAIITPAFGRVWPIALPQIASVSVTYEAGYASPIVAQPGATFKVIGPVIWAVGARVQFYNSGGALPAPLDAESSYLIATAANGVYTLTDEAGAPITFTSTGVGRTFIGVVPEGIRSWMLLRAGALYENREEVVVGARVVVLELPYIDGLLDPYCTGLY